MGIEKASGLRMTRREKELNMPEKVILAYSGGVDTSVSIKWIPEKYHLDVITLTVDIGNVPDLEAIKI